MKKAFLLTAGILAFSLNQASAGDLHYKDILIGERASGMGGAYVAVADDPSGMYHNPAGIVFSQENYFSLSANAFSSATQKFEGVVPGQDYSYTSQSLLPAFFGFTQSLGKHKIGFSVVVPKSDLIDQDDQITGLSTTDLEPNTFRRRFFNQDITYLAGPSYAFEVVNNLTFGVSAYGFYRFLNIIDNQLLIYNPVPTGTYFEQSLYARVTSYGLAPKFGIQYMPVPRLSLGATAAFTVNAGGKGSSRVFQSKTDPVTGAPVDYQNSYDADKTLKETSISPDQPTNPSLSLGAAYFLSKRAMFSGQVDYHFSDQKYRYRTTVNLSGGGEVYFTEELAVRAGVYTNNSKSPALNPNKTNQLPHVNMLGGTLAIALCKPGSSLSIGGSYSAGSGEGQAIGNTQRVQTVFQSQIAFYLTGSYQL